MKREFNVEANVGAPQVAYRETLQNASEFEYTHKKQSGGAGQFAKVKLLVEPQEPGSGRSVESKIKGGAIPKEFIPGVEKGIETISDGGILAGFPMIDYKVTILDGLHHDVDSSVLAFELAGRACFKEACTRGTLKLLEPVMRVEVVTPEDYMGDVIGDLNSRRGQISTQENRGNATVITAMVPLANMFGYINSLRSMSQGRALAKEDPSFRVTSDEESGQTIIKGMGELHLDIIVDRMKREFNVEANVGAPQVAYRETLQNASEFEYTHKKQSGGAGQFAKVKLLVEPQEPGSGRSVESKIKGGAIPKEFIPGVEKGIETISDGGILAGFPMIDYKVTILDGLHHDVDSSVLAFELAGRACFKEACTRGTLKLLEPVMRVEVVTPEDYMGDVIGDLNSRRGQISTQENRGNATVITAMVPLANMFGYINSLRSMSQGRAQYSMFFDHYSKVPQNVQDEVTKKIAG